MNRYTSRFVSASLLFVSVALVGCDEALVPPPPLVTLGIPQQYSFDSRFAANASSVSYEGQTVRNLLVQDLASAMAALAKPGAQSITERDLLKLYEHADADNLSSTTTISGRVPLEARYTSIAERKKLSDKLSSANVIGYGVSADMLVRAWIRTIALNSQDPSKLGTPSVLFDEKGLDIAEIVNKVLLGAIAYHQGTTVYIGGLLSKNNGVGADDGNGGARPYTEMEHSWDEAFGYLGAARDYARYSDEQLAGTSADYSYDSNNDGKIDFRSEYNFSFARYAGRRDKSAATDLTKEVFDAFLRGRTAIANTASSVDIAAHSDAACVAWERILAATVVHYLNEVDETMQGLSDPLSDFASLRHEWSEMKGYLVTLQFNGKKRISDAQLEQLHALVGDRPVVAMPATGEHAAYRASLNAARSIIKGAYGFTDAQMSAW